MMMSQVAVAPMAAWGTPPSTGAGLEGRFLRSEMMGPWGNVDYRGR
jgi:hypothetical protein